jgi:hypothetical protein
VAIWFDVVVAAAVAWFLTVYKFVSAETVI